MRRNRLFKLPRFSRRFSICQLESQISREKIEEREWASSHRDTFNLKIEQLQSILPTKHISAPNTLAYLQERGWSASSSQEERILTSLFSFPLTLSFGLKKILQPPIKQNLTITILGARAESSLPIIWWRETIISCEKLLNLQIYMIGPGLMPASRGKLLSTIWNKQEEYLREVKIGSFFDGMTELHSHPRSRSLVEETDVFVLFNPGLGATEELKRSWGPTLSLLLKSGKPVIGTAHSDLDLERDQRALLSSHSHSSFFDSIQFLPLFSPVLNPFRSLKRTFDPKEEFGAREVLTNKYIYAVQAQKISRTVQCN